MQLVILGITMLTLYRRHRAKCKMKGRRAKCSCPIWAQGVLHGEKIRESLDLTNWEAAQKRIRDWEIDGKKNVVLLEDAFDRYLGDHEANSSAADTIAKHRRLKKLMVAFFGNCPVRGITVDELDRFRQSWKFGPTTATNTINRIRAFFNFCVKREWIEKNPGKHLTIPKVDTIDRKPFDQDELKKIWAAVDEFPNWGIYGSKTRDRLRAFLLTLRWTGMRIGDVIQLEDAKIIDDQITIRTTKTGQRVSIPMHPETKAALEKIKNGNRFYFWSGEGKLKSAVSAWERTIKRLYKITKFRCHAHRFRHNLATELLAKGIPVSEVAAILGNSPKMIEKVYSQWIPRRQDSINQALKEAWGK
jgi:integrase/recombinase XerD